MAQHGVDQLVGIVQPIALIALCDRPEQQPAEFPGGWPGSDACAHGYHSIRCVRETSVRSLAPEFGIRRADPLGGWSKRLLGERNLLSGTRPVGLGALRTEFAIGQRSQGRPAQTPNWRAGRPPPEGRPRYCGAPLRHHPHTGPLRVGSGASSARRSGSTAVTALAGLTSLESPMARPGSSTHRGVSGWWWSGAVGPGGASVR